MPTIKESCCCGAVFYVKDHVVFGNSVADRYREFLDAHKICREADSMRHKIKKTTTYVNNDEEKK